MKSVKKIMFFLKKRFENPDICSEQLINILTSFNSTELTINTVHNNNGLDTVKIFLSKLDITKLNIEASLDQINQLSETININNHIKYVTGAIYTYSEIPTTSIIPLLKIKKIKINSLDDIRTESITKIFELAPNFTKFYLSEFGAHILKKLSHTNNLKLFVNHIRSNMQFEQLYLSSDHFYEEEIKYLCDNLIDTNIKKLILGTYKSMSHDETNSLCNFITNNSTVTHIKLFLKSISNIYEIIDAVRKNTSIINFHVIVMGIMTHDGWNKLEIFANNHLAENYNLLEICIETLEYQYPGCKKINDINITCRNRIIAERKRFITTKVVTQKLD